MNFVLTDEQAMIRDAVERVTREQCSFQTRRASIASEDGWQRDFWCQLGELGILGASLPESVGGLGGGAIVVMLVMQIFGKALVIAPYVPTIVCAANIIARGGSAAQREEHLPSILQGRRIFAFACAEHEAGRDIGQLHTVAEKDGDSYRISGHKSLVVGGGWADWIIVVARLNDFPEEVSAFIVAADEKGVSIASHRTIDGGSASEITFDNVLVGAEARIGPADGARELIERILDEATAAVCAEATGAVDALLSATIEYAKVRKQFGQSIGKFQVIQHRMVDMLLARDQAAAISHMASLNLDAEPNVRQRAVSAAKAHIGRVGRRTAQAAVQIHGGIGITDEIDISHYFRRIEVIDMQFGNIDDHVRRYATLLDA